MKPRCKLPRCRAGWRAGAWRLACGLWPIGALPQVHPTTLRRARPPAFGSCTRETDYCILAGGRVGLALLRS